MKNFYLAVIYFITLAVKPCLAEVIAITDPQNFKPEITQISLQEMASKNLPDPNDREAVRAFFKKRFEEASTSTGIDISKSGSGAVNIIHTPEYYAAQKEKEKPIFQKMYEEAVRTIQGKEAEENAPSADAQFSPSEQQAAEQATRFFTLSRSETQQPVVEPERIPTVSFALPSGRKVLAPAMEHIPYFLSYIDIMSNGYIKIEDTIVVVAEGKKFSQAMHRKFPKYVYDKDNKPKRIELILNSVTVNGTDVPYTTEEIGNDIVIKPKHTQKLQSGVYTYVFDYMVNNSLNINNNDVYMTWNLTGKPLNSFITSANAIVTLPSGHGFKGVQSLVGRSDHLSDRRTNIFALAKSSMAFSGNKPLLNGETMNIVAVADRNAFIKDFNRSFASFLLKWGNVFYALIGLFFILLAYALSLLTLHKEKPKKNYNPSGNGSLIRQISIGKYDRVALIAQILDLFRKDALDISTQDQRTVLNKRNISTKLSPTDKKALKLLFTKKRSVFEVNKTTASVIKKVAKLYERTNKKQIRKFSFLHNAGYLSFSILMLILTEIFISYISINMFQSLIVLLTTSALYAFYIWILRYKFKKIYTVVIVKLLALCGTFLVWLFSGVYIGMLTSAVIFIMIFLIFEFTKIFAQRNNFLEEAKNLIDNYRNFLLENKETIGISRDFINHQPGIFALAIEDSFAANAATKKYYRLDQAENLRQQLVGIL